MTDLRDWPLTPIIDHNDNPVYAEPDIRRIATRVIDLPRGLLAVRIEGIHVEVVLFELSGGPMTRNGIEVDPATYNRVFHGSGPSGSLRELRHTYWGEPDNSGYIFYPNGKLIAAAFEALKEWFDCD